MRENIMQSLAFVLDDEGSELNIAASEPGGSSHFGVSMTVLREWHVEKGMPPASMDNMKAVDAALAGAIYTEKFALPISFDNLPAGVDYRLLDIAVNLGVTGGIHTLQDALGLPHGPMDNPTLQAATVRDPRALVLALGAAWLANKRAGGGWAKYGPGWTNRAVRAEARALAMLAKPQVVLIATDTSDKTTVQVQGASMTWKGIIGRGFTADEFKDYVAGLRLASWRPSFVVIHNTSAPSAALYRQWQGRPGWSGEQWLRNLESYYKGMGWSGGPHLFVAPDKIWAFTPLTGSGTHSPAWNSITWGVETVGEFGTEPFSGTVKDNLISALATLHSFAGLNPVDYQKGVRGLHFHREDPVTTHKTCPGRNMVKADLVAAVAAEMQAQNGGGHAHIPVEVQTAPTDSLPADYLTSNTWLQQRLNVYGAELTVDGDAGALTKAAVLTFQKSHGLVADGIAGPLTRLALAKVA